MSQKYIIHLLLKYLRGTGDLKWQFIETKPSKWCNKGGQQPGIYQNPLLASRLLNIVAPDNCASVVSTLGIGCTSLKTLSLRGFRSTQIRTVPVSLGMTTIAECQGVGSSKGEMTSKLCIYCKSFAPLSSMGGECFLECLMQIAGDLVST